MTTAPAVAAPGGDALQHHEPLSGDFPPGLQGRLLFARLMLQKPNILVMDEPTNHLDMESIESLNLALEHYPGTLIFVSHDRQFVSSLATRIIELRADGVVEYGGDYEHYLNSQGIEGAELLETA